MALPSFNIVFHLVALINSSLAILLGDVPLIVKTVDGLAEKSIVSVLFE